MRYECDSCGATSENGTGFRAVRGYVRVRGYRCGACHERTQARDLARSVRDTLVIGGVAAVVVALPEGALPAFAGRIAFLVLNLWVVLIPAYAVAVVFHELAHALVGRALGFRVFGVRIGVGRRLVHRRLRGVDLDWHAWPVGGWTTAASESPDWLGPRLAALLLAGPASHLLWIGLAVSLVPGGDAGLLRTTSGLQPLACFTLVNAIALVASLLPYATGGQPSDGLALLSLLFAPRKTLAAKRGDYWLLAGLRALEDRDFGAAAAEVDAGLARHPGHILLRILRADVAALGGRPDAGAESLRALLEDPGLSDLERAIASNDLAFALTLAGRPEGLAEAEAASRLALEKLGEQGAVLATRGGVLVDLGRAAEAWPLLQQALDRTPNEAARAFVRCHLARAARALGRAAEAHAHLERALALDPDCPLRERTERALREPPGAVLRELGEEAAAQPLGTRLGRLVARSGD